MPKKKIPGLNMRQQRFVAEYCVDQNGGEAAKRAGYAASSAYEEASRQLRNVRIRDAIQRFMNDQLSKRGVKVLTIINRLDDIAGCDPLELFNPDTNKFLDLKDIPLDVRRCIKDVSVKEDLLEGVPVAVVTKITFFDRIKANELLGKYLKMFNDEIEVKHTHTLESLVTGTPERDVSPTKMIEAAGEDQL